MGLSMGLDTRSALSEARLHEFTAGLGGSCLDLGQYTFRRTSIERPRWRQKCIDQCRHFKPCSSIMCVLNDSGIYLQFSRLDDLLLEAPAHPAITGAQHTPPSAWIPLRCHKPPSYFATSGPHHLPASENLHLSHHFD